MRRSTAGAGWKDRGTERGRDGRTGRKDVGMVGWLAGGVEMVGARRGNVKYSGKKIWDDLYNIVDLKIQKDKNHNITLIIICWSRKINIIRKGQAGGEDFISDNRTGM